MTKDQARRAARAAAKRHGLDPDIFERQIGAESGFSTKARSGAGAQGIAQIMPGTARAWGVNPNDPKAALDAAAKHMAGYVRKYGSYEAALRAYNAGEGAIEASKGYKETNAYVKKILGGKDPGGKLAPAQRAAAKATTRAVPSQDVEGALVDALTQRRPGQSLLVAAAQALDTGAYDRVTQMTSSPTAARAASVHTGGFKGSPINEQFYDPLGGRDEGHEIGAIGHHGGHVHAAAGPKTVLWLAKLAQKYGLKVGENPKYGGVAPVHTKGSFHYSGRAIDVTGDPKKLAAFYRAVKAYDQRTRGKR